MLNIQVGGSLNGILHRMLVSSVAVDESGIILAAPEDNDMAMQRN